MNVSLNGIFLEIIDELFRFRIFKNVLTYIVIMLLQEW